MELVQKPENTSRMGKYKFDPDSSTYKYWQSETDTCVGGFVLLFDPDIDEEPNDYEILEQTERIQNIKFKPV